MTNIDMNYKVVVDPDTNVCEQQPLQFIKGFLQLQLL